MSIKSTIQKRKLRKAENSLSEENRHAITALVKVLLEKDKNKRQKHIENVYDRLGKEIDAFVSAVEKELETKLSTQKDKAVNEIMTLNKESAEATKEEYERVVAEISTEAERLFGERSHKILQDIKKNVDKMQGPKGEKGEQGKDGSPDKPEDVAKKLNKTEESVNMSVIKGLLEEIEKLKKKIKQGGGKSGGGMGKPQHESFSLTSSTTSIKTAYPIAAGGTAIFPAAYQGQVIIKDTSYTVGSDKRTLTLLFTPVDGTYLDITYVRGS